MVPLFFFCNPLIFLLYVEIIMLCLFLFMFFDMFVYFFCSDLFIYFTYIFFSGREKKWQLSFSMRPFTWNFISVYKTVLRWLRVVWRHCKTYLHFRLEATLSFYRWPAFHFKMLSNSQKTASSINRTTQTKL